MKNSSKKNIVITMGDPSGIGPEIIAKALAQKSLLAAANFIIVGDQTIFSKYDKNNFPRFDFIDISVSKKKIFAGQPNAYTGKAALAYLDKAVELVATSKADAIVTAPLAKQYIQKSDKNFIGHTEYLAQAAGSKEYGMMFVAPKLKTILTTRHIALKKVPKVLTTSLILDTIKLTNKALKENFSIRSPKIGVCGLNPHASENGIFGEEDIKVVTPAIKKANRLKIKAVGPLAADTLFVPENSKDYDCIVSMYHDQGLIAIKSMHFNQLVNLTVGLPFIRTSPAHGTAFDIAGKRKANEFSMIEAIKLAVKLS